MKAKPSGKATCQNSCDEGETKRLKRPVSHGVTNVERQIFRGMSAALHCLTGGASTVLD